MSIPEGLFRTPYAKATDPNRYLFRVGNTIHQVSNPDELEAQYGKIFDQLQWGYNPNSNEGVTGGAVQSFQQSAQMTQQMKEQNLPYISSYNQGDVSNPNYAMITKNGSQQLVPRNSLSDWQSVGWTETKPPAQQQQQSNPTEFQTYFQQERAKGRTAEDIMSNNPFMAGGARAPTPDMSGGGAAPVNGGAPAGQPNPTIDSSFADLPNDIRNSPEWALLTPDQKTLAYFTFKTQTATNEAQRKDALDALERAKQLADPYFKEQLRMAQDEISRASTSTTADAQSKIATLNDRIKAIKEDLTFNKGQLSLEQQQEMSDQLRKNQNDLFSLQQNMAESGLAFSSPRQQAESDLLATQQGIAESTNRKYARLNQQNELGATRDLTTANQNLGDINRNLSENLTSISRAGEAKIGTANVPAVSGVDTLGGITGALDENRQNQILDLQNVLQQRANPLKL